MANKRFTPGASSHKETALRFLSYYMRTVPLSSGSTGENHSITPWKVFDRFIKLPENKDLIPLTYNQELEESQKEISILVDNNNGLKDKCETLELKAAACPAMYEALKQIASWDSFRDHPIGKKARAALAAANPETKTQSL